MGFKVRRGLSSSSSPPKAASTGAFLAGGGASRAVGEARGCGSGAGAGTGLRGALAAFIMAWVMLSLGSCSRGWALGWLWSGLVAGVGEWLVCPLAAASSSAGKNGHQNLGIMNVRVEAVTCDGSLICVQHPPFAASRQQKWTAIHAGH